MIERNDITGLVLAGGRGARMGGVDKGLQLFRGQALAHNALQRLAPQVGSCLVNANRHLERYADFGSPVCSDKRLDYAGPLAGFLAGIAQCNSSWLLTVPCDSPLFPLDLAQRLAQAAEATNAEIVFAASPDADHQGRLRTQPVFCLLRTSLHASLERFTAQGGRKIDVWSQAHRCTSVAFDLRTDAIHAFANANTLDELLALEQLP